MILIRKPKIYICIYALQSKEVDYIIDDEINANNIKVEEDTGDMATYCVGYGDYTDEQGITGAGLIMKFEHPDMKDIGKYEENLLKMVVLKMKN